MNPFNNPFYRTEQQLGNAYQDVRKLIQNLETLQLLADNIENFRSGNVRFKSEGNNIYWGYQESEEWNLLGSFVLNSDITNLLSEINQIHILMGNQNDTIVGLQNQNTGQGSDITALKTFRTTTTNALTTINNTLLDLIDRIEDLELNAQNVTQELASLDLRVQALEVIDEGGEVEG